MKGCTLLVIILNCRSEENHLDNLKMLFPNYSTKDLEKALADAQNDFDLALSFILLENELANAPDGSVFSKTTPEAAIPHP